MADLWIYRIEGLAILMGSKLKEGGFFTITYNCRHIPT